MSVLGKIAQYIDPTKVLGNRAHLNSKLLPNDANAGTRFSYLTTDGSNDGGYIAVVPALAITYGGVVVTYGGVPVTYGA